MHAVNWLREAAWLNGPRARAYARIIAIGGILLLVALTAAYLNTARTDPQGRPYLRDFNAYWSAARLAISGHPQLAYDPAALKAQEALTTQPGANGGFLPFMYPPVFLLLCLIWAPLPYLSAIALFLATTTAAFCASIRPILPKSWPLYIAAASPAVLINAASTQNSCISGALFCGAMSLLATRPALAGVLLGMFAFKPQLAICLPVALAFGGRWRAFAAAGASAAVLGLASCLIFGTGVWSAFMQSSSITRSVLNASHIWTEGNSVYSAARMLHAGLGVGLAIQAVAAALALSCVAWVCSRRPGAGPEMAVSVACAFLCTPYVMDYDLVSLGAPMAWLAARATATAWRPWEKLLLGALYLFPLAARSLDQIHVPLAPPFIIALLVLLIRRIGSGHPAANPTSAPDRASGHDQIVSVS
jgi:hypothetical protein